MKHPATRLLLLVLIPLIGSLPALAAESYTGSQWSLVDAKKTLAAAADITATKYPNCDEATVDEKMVQDYHPDGTGGNQDEAYIKVLTEKGKRDRRTLSLGFLLPYFNVAIARLEVIKPDGKVLPVDVAANSTVAIDNGQMDENIYDPNAKVLQVNIADLEIGDVLHWVVHYTTMRSIMPGEFSDLNTFEGSGFILHTTYDVYAPAVKPLQRIVVRDEIPGTMKYTTAKEGDGTLLYHWEVANVPRMYDEPSMPPYENVLQRVLVSTTPSWEDVSKWYWALSQPHLEATSPELKKTVADLTVNAQTDMNKMKALFYYVSQKIRYMGLTPEKDRPGFEPHDVSMTFAKQYGVCRDKAALLVEMLRTAGLKAYPVLVNVGSKKDADIPDADFNHAIVGVETSKGQYTLLDPTDEHARDLQPWYDGNQSYLVCRPEGETLRTSSYAPPEDNMLRIRTTGVLTAAGHMDGKTQIWFDGANDDIYRNAFSEMKADDIRRYFEQHLKKELPGASLTSLKITPENMLDVSKEIGAQLEFTVDGVTANGHGKCVVSVPWLGDGMGVINHVLDGTGLDKRKYPLQTRVACGLDEQVSLKLEDGFGNLESIPICKPVEDSVLGYHQDFSQQSGTINCSRVLKLKVVEIAPRQYPELKQTLKDMEYDARKALVLSVPNQPSGPELAADPPAAQPVESNAIVLDSRKELDVTGAHSAVYRVKFTKKILTFAGKIDEAEIKLDYDPACEDAKLIRGTVISRTGERQEISKGEINVMDAGWNASAKRYTGGKILVANLPGVDLGSTIEVEFEITMKDMPYIGGFEPFQLGDDLQQKTFRLTAPAGLKVQKLVTGSAPLKGVASTGNDGSQSYVWSARKINALPAETDTPPDWVYKPGVTYYVGDFNAYLKDLNNTLEDRSRSRAKVAALVQQIASKSGDKLETLTAIRDYVAKSIREAGPSFTDLPLSELSAADTTLTDGYGHAADRAILLHAMLSAAGFKPEFVLASDLPPMDAIRGTTSKIPLPDSFTAPLVKVVVDGDAYYLNDTDQYAKLGSAGHEDRLAINLSSGASEVIEPAKDCQDRIETDYTLSFANDGNARIGVTKHFFGNEYNNRNRFFSELRPEEKNRYYQEAVSDIDQGARPVSDLTEQFDTYPGTEKFTVELDNYAVVDGKYLYFDLPFTPTLVQLPGGDQRSLPLMLSHEGTSSVRTEIDLPLGFRDVLIAPATESLNAPAGGGKVRVTSAGSDGKIVLTDNFETSPAVINPNDYQAMLKLESTLERKSSKVFLLEKE
ncbi:MAG: DUF3857 domain-containing protein [Chthoniobacteraceae bacterium]|jgi:transglutaminase-like putative cysteine protease